MTVSVAVEVRPLKGWRAHYGAWRATAAAPAMLGSLALLLVLFGFLGRWEPVAILGWLASGAVVLTRFGERATVRTAMGFRPLTSRQAAALAGVWRAALAQAGYRADQIDLYLQQSATVNAYAAGGRSVAVSSGALREFLARRLSGDRMRAVLVHELGHHGTGGTRFSLVVLWLAMPWRAASRLVVGLCHGLAGRRQPLTLLGIVVLAAVMIAVGTAVQQGHWAVAAVLSGVIVCAVVCPLADAYVARHSEFAADRFAAAGGAAPDLAAALVQLGGGVLRVRGIAWLESRHPSIERRVDALANWAGQRGRPGGGGWR
jgi:STE24 endopeptidase